jgi:hypothetical protein
LLLFFISQVALPARNQATVVAFQHFQGLFELPDPKLEDIPMGTHDKRSFVDYIGFQNTISDQRTNEKIAELLQPNEAIAKLCVQFFDQSSTLMTNEQFNLYVWFNNFQLINLYIFKGIMF